MRKIMVGALVIFLLGLAGYTILAREEGIFQKEIGWEVTTTEKEEPMIVSVKSGDYTVVYELNHSQAAKELYAQLPLTLEVKPYSDNEMTFYPPRKLRADNTPQSRGEIGSLSYYKPWGDVVMFYGPCNPNEDLVELGKAVSGAKNIPKLSGKIKIYADKWQIYEVEKK